MARREEKVDDDRDHHGELGVRAIERGADRDCRRTGRTVDFRAAQSRFKIFLTNESSCAASAEPRIFSRVNRQFVEPDTHEKRIVRTR